MGNNLNILNIHVHCYGPQKMGIAGSPRKDGISNGTAFMDEL